MQDTIELKGLRKALYALIVIIVLATHVLVTGVVVLFLLSTLNILNSSVMHFQNVRLFEFAVIGIIFIISIVILIRSYKKMSLFIKATFFYRRNH